MKCPKCGNELPSVIMEREYWDFHNDVHCDYCHKKLSVAILKPLVTEENCFACHDGDFEKEKFDPEYCCDDCMRENCIFAKCDAISDFGMVQDEEDNWCYPEDIDQSEED